ncbi:MAG: homocysteine biosynthesis protein [Dehalococcoidia bacterium]|nr:homocysteine biosynthesis protein [Dehalococcoidia bacterium]
MDKTIDEINAKIKQGKAVIATAEEIIKIAQEKGLSQTARDVDVVTTGTFGPMCSSGAYFNIGHTKPRLKLGGGKATLNDVPAYTGFAAADLMLGANAIPDNDPRNRSYPGEFNYGGGHVIEDLVAGKDVRLIASGYGTDCYPRTSVDTLININDLNEAVLFNPRNAYQNYNVAVNTSDKTLYTYMGILKPRLANANYCSAGQLSPLLNDPYLKTIGIGTRIFLGGGIGYVAWNGTQHNPMALRSENGVPKRGACTLAVIGDLKQMNSRWLRGISMLGYGATMAVGIGVPIPVINEEVLEYTLVSDSAIMAPVVDYSSAYPNREANVLAEISYAELKSGKIDFNGKQIVTAALSSYSRAVEIASTLKEWLMEGKFFLTEPVAPLPGINDNTFSNVLTERN